MISTMKSYVQPKLVVLPYDTFDQSIKLSQHISIGDILHKNKNSYATVSGTVIQFIELDNTSNQKEDYVVIKNDTLNTINSDLKSMSIKTIIHQYLKKSNDLETFDFDQSKTLILDLVFYDEPFATIDEKFLMDHYDIIIDSIKELKAIFSLEKVVLLIKDDASSKWADNPDLNLVIRRVKPTKNVDFRHQAINATFNQAIRKNASYNYLTLESILKIHEMMRYHRPSVINTLVVHGDAIKNPTIFKVRVGTLFSDLKRIFDGYTTNKPLTIHHNNRLLNKTILNDYFAISHDTHGLFIQEHREREVYDCIACGLCNTKCPASILPSKIMHAVEHDIYLKRMRTDLCIECGLCSYYCPSKIPVMAFVKEAKNLLRGLKDA